MSSLIIFPAILGFASATMLDSLLPLVPALDPKDRISEIENVLVPAIGPEDAKLTTMELISKNGYKGELHTVITSDGYILELHRIMGKINSTEPKVPKPVAFVMHGLLCSSAVWVLSGPKKSLGFILADAGYDVWLGNARGSLYARKHSLSSVTKKDYWNFSWHEIGIRDLPTMINYVLETTGQNQLFYLGHSQGTTSFFVMATELPEYQSKIKAMFAMAPIVYSGRMKSPFLQLLSHFSFTIDKVSSLIGVHEFSPSNDFIKTVQQIVCAENAITQVICSNALFLVAGFNNEQLDKSLLPVILGHVPAGSSVKQFVHYGQLIRSGLYVSPGKFKQYDHGLIGNIRKYESPTPPNYNVTKIQVPVALHYSKNDWLANVKDVEKLYSELGNPIGKFLVSDKKFNHLDYMWAKDVKKLLYDKILTQMAKLRK